MNPAPSIHFVDLHRVEHPGRLQHLGHEGHSHLVLDDGRSVVARQRPEPTVGTWHYAEQGGEHG